MNHRERAVAALRGLPVDHIPFIARMDLWFNYHQHRGSLPRPYQRSSLWDLQRDLGIGIFGFGAWAEPFYTLRYPAAEVSTATRDGLTLTEYRTPYGTLTGRDVMAAELQEAAGAGARIEFPFKAAADYPALHCVVESGQVCDNLEAYARSVAPIGDDGLALPNAGHLPAHQLMLKWMGYERFYYELHDHPAQVERLIEALTAQYRSILRLADACGAEAVEIGGNYDEHMTPPRVFDALFAPLYRESRELLPGKVVVTHGDGEMRRLLENLMRCGIQAVEALTPQPMTSIDLARTRRLWQDRVTLWGGLPSTLFTPTYSDAEFEQFLDSLFAAVAPGDRFILGFGDNLPTDALFARLKRVVQYWMDHGRYPIGRHAPAGTPQ